MRVAVIIGSSLLALGAVVACSSSSGGGAGGGDGGGSSSSGGGSSGGTGSSGGSGGGSDLRLLLASGQKQPGGIASNGTTVVWTTNTGLEGGNENGTGPIMAVSPSGGTPTVLVPAADNGAEIAVDATNAYWYGPGTSTINKVPLAGGAAVQLEKNLTDSPYGMAIDATNFCTGPTHFGIPGVPLAGGTNTNLCTLADAGFNAQYNTEQIAVSPAGIFVLGEDGILKIPLGGGGATTLVPGQKAATAVVADATSVYWGNGGGVGIMKAPVGGGSPTSLTPLTITEVPSFLVLDGDTLYWIEVSGSVKKVPIAGGSPSPSRPPRRCLGASPSTRRTSTGPT